ncbi:MAG: nuclear transport factor 2 family protein [Phycisphaerales bacterium]
MPIPDDALTDFATRYAGAWSGGDPDALASFYAPDGRLIVNAGAPAIGRAQIAAAAGAFMAAFPDMVVALDRLERIGERVRFHWRWTGTNTGPGGTGAAVDMRGYEEWTLRDDGAIAVSDGHYDEAEYARQVGA